MNSSNFRKPIGPKDISSHTVGNTYGERKRHSNNIAPEAQIQLPRDVFGTGANEQNRTIERFSSDAKYLGAKRLSAHKLIESGQAHKKPKVSDEARLSFLNRIISASAENVTPAHGLKKPANIKKS